MSLLNNLKSFVSGKQASKVVTPADKAKDYANKLEASNPVKQEALRLVHQAEVTKDAVKRNLTKAEDRKKSEVNDQAALNKLMTDLEAIAIEVVTNQETTKKLHGEASELEKTNKEIRDQLATVSFSTIIAATKSATKTNTVKGV